MNADNRRADNIHRWTLLQKIAFRFFFVFLLLQVLTEGFLGLPFRDSNFVIWNSIAERFTQPCLWLNDHFFHYKYIPQVWSTFSGALHTIRDIIYLLTSVLVCAIWTVLDSKRASYNKVYYWFSRFLITMLSASVFFYGIIKIFPTQMAAPSFIDMEKPLGDFSPFWLLWRTFGYGKPFQVFFGILETAGALFILFRRIRVTGLFLIAATMINVIIIDYTYSVGNVMITAFYMLLITLFLLAPYLKQLFLFFFTQQPVALSYRGYVPQKRFIDRVVTGIIVVFLTSTFISNTHYAYGVYARRMNINKTIQYSVIKNQLINGDTLQPILNDDLRWRSWFERVRDGQRLVTITTMNSVVDKNYRIEEDSVNSALILYPMNQADSASLKFNYTKIDDVNWQLEGTVRQKNMLIELQRVNPDTVWTLLKIKPQLIIFDDWSDQE